MTRPVLILLLLLTFCFGMAARLHQSHVAWEEEGRSGSVLNVMLGDGRRMFANHFFAKADAYFHKGKYPSIFDEKAEGEELHMTEEGHEGHDHESAEEDAQEEAEARPGNEPLDWIERFGRQFAPSQHVHLGEGEEREMLPWLRLAAEMDPQKVETYVVAAYWLRTKLDKAEDAELFLREGLKANPGSPEILYELGRIQFEHHHDLDRARNLWNAALTAWRKQEGDKVRPDMLLFLQIVSGMARLEQDAGNIDQAIEHLELLEQASPNPEAVEQLILQLRTSGDQNQ
jgi:tetratricopeptide (TPR) repeat protein